MMREALPILFLLTLYFLTTNQTTPTDEDEKEGRRCSWISEGDQCTPEECEPCGYCWELASFYFTCNLTLDPSSDPKTPRRGIYTHHSCDDHLWWNPRGKGQKGGACDHWANLHSNMQQKYLADPNCVKIEEVCEWGQDLSEQCTKHYWYFDPNTMQDRVNHECNGDLVWDPSRQTCALCSSLPHCKC